MVNVLLSSVGLASAAGENAALNQPAFMSTTYQPRVASLANDGDHSTSVPDCAFTLASDQNPWWAVDLGAESTVVEVKYTLVDNSLGI